LNRLTALTTPNSGYLYQLGPTGNRTNATELTGRTLNWSFDGIYQLTSETISQDPAGKNGAVGYGLDPVGNRLSANSTLSGVSSGSYSYSLNDLLLFIETYDSNGNTLTSGGKVFAYDSENRLKSMNGDAVTLLYDGDGNRVAKAASGVTTRYLVDDLNPTGYSQVVEEVVNGAVQREYTYGLQRISQNQVISSTWTPSFYGYDGMGSVRHLTNPAGVITDKYDYDAFGNLVNSTGTTPNNYRYRGEQYDADLGLYYLRARYYNPQTGRFMSRDPAVGKLADPKSFHKYLYVGGNPIDALDPTGWETMTETAQLDFWGALKNAAAVTAIAVGAVCLLHDVQTLVQGASAHLGWQLAYILPSGPCSVSVKKCRPCSPPVGTLGYRLDMDPQKPHFDKPTQTYLDGPHWHLFEVHQSPPSSGCICSWRNLGLAGEFPPLPLGAVDIETTPCTGGGIE
jgi:RHS repeat-associated protein